MTRWTLHVVTGIGVAILTAASIAAQHTPLNVKTGLWETTTTSSSSGMPSVDLSSLPPERRAQVEAMMKGRQNGAPQTHTQQSCVTKEKLEKEGFQQERREGCTQTVTTSTGTVQEVKVVCTGEHPSTALAHFEAASPESIKGTIKVTTSAGRGGGDMTININLTGKWLAESCGSVK